MRTEFQPVFARLSEILRKHAGALKISADTPNHFSLEGEPGPAAIRAWGGKLRRPVMPVAWVEIGKNYVSYHLMPVYGNARLLDTISKELKARMQGKSCFNFTQVDETLMNELEQMTAQAMSAFRKAGYVTIPASS